MDIVCPKCKKLHTIADKDIPARRSAARCKICNSWMIIQPKSEDQQATPPFLTDIDESADHVHNLTGELIWDESEHELETLSKFGEELLGCTEESGMDPEEISVFGQSILGNVDAEIFSHITGVDKNDIFAVFPRLHDFDRDVFSFEDIFSVHERSGYKTGENLLKLRLIETSYSVLVNRILVEGEKIHKVARGIAYYPFEIIYLNGLLTAFSNHFAVFCTTRRIIFKSSIFL